MNSWLGKGATHRTSPTATILVAGLVSRRTSAWVESGEYSDGNDKIEDAFYLCRAVGVVVLKLTGNRGREQDTIFLEVR